MTNKTENKKALKVPYHLAVIIDGNRRWAKERRLPIFEGHRQGFNNVKKISEEARKMGVKILTFYGFSTENWKRSKLEVKNLMRLIERAFSKKYINELISKGVALRVIGEKNRLSKNLQGKIKRAESLTRKGKNGILNLAISYGGRLEIIQAIKKIISKKIPAGEVNEDIVSKNLWTAGLPYPDFLIRTGKEKRLSNFLIWQSAYSELYFVNKYWPDFNKNDLEDAFLEYQKRQRRFGE
ncbi:MAG TPA: di-trans,poly-cis-decaprenylcistransferase [Candidatus Parcubacteria bacterium]|nr:di-trans,poly-cis-decaprenylcistransferase [Candidatus Parcubacteria bacterium]